MNTEPNDLAQRIKDCRLNLRESQKVFGKRFGVTHLAVGNWERGTRPHRRHETALVLLLKDAHTKEQHHDPTYQLQLPFDQPINLELKISPQRADTLQVELHLKRKVG